MLAAQRQAAHGAVLVADIRLDNRAELADTLDLHGAAGLADSALLLAAWQRWGRGCVAHLVGAFCFLVWEPATRTLFAARDHSGIRSLYYYAAPGFFALATEPSALLALPTVAHELDRQALAETLLLLPPALDRTVFGALRRLPAGHSLTRTTDDLRVERFWHPGDARPIRFRRDQDYAEALAEVLERAVAACLRSTSPIATELSAGLDSSAVTALAARLLAARGGEGLTAYTAIPRPGFSGPVRSSAAEGTLADEGQPAAEFVAAFPNLRHVLVDSDAYRLVSTLKRWGDAMAAPPLNPVNFLWVSALRDRVRADGCRVLLSGAAGNGTISFEALFGFGAWFRQGRWLTLAKAACRLRARGETTGRRTLFYALEGLVPEPVRRALLRQPPGGDVGALDLSYTLLRPELVEHYGLGERLNAILTAEPASLEALREAFFLRSESAADRLATEALTGVEVRDPTADRRVWEFCHAVPAEQFLVGGETRSLLRRAMRGRMPERTRLRYDYGLQGADWPQILQGELPALKAELERVQESAAVRALVDVERAQWLLEHWPSTGFETARVAGAWHFALTRGLSVAGFVRDRT